MLNGQHSDFIGIIVDSVVNQITIFLNNAPTDIGTSVVLSYPGEHRQIIERANDRTHHICGPLRTSLSNVVLDTAQVT